MQTAPQPPVIIFCADTDTGYRLAQLLRREQRQVIAVMRPRADTSLIEKMGCQIVRADPSERKTVESIFAQQVTPDCEVVSMLGGSPQLNSQGNINVIDATAASGTRRLVLLTSIGCGDSLAAVDPFVKAFIGKSLRAKNWAEQQLLATDLDWTIIRPGGLVRRATRGEAMLIEDSKVSGHINTFDLGDLIYQALLSPATIGRVLAAVDSDRAFHLDGEPLTPARL